jgi:cell division protein FtsB
MTAPRRPSSPRRPREQARGRARAGTAPARATPARTQPARPRTRTAGPKGAGDAAPRRASLTGRAAVLALVVCLLAISLAYPLREYLAQRGEIGDYQTKVAAQEKRVAELERTQQRWRDPAYVAAQARERLHFVMPGETQYVVLEPEEAPAPTGGPGSAASPAPQHPWFTDLWRSVEVAGKS